MSLPTTKNRTVATAQRISRADMLALQDCQIARYQRGMAFQWVRTTPALIGHGAAGTQWATVGAGLYRQATGAADLLVMPVALPVGVRIFQVAARIYGGGGAAITCDVYRLRYATGVAASVISGSGTSSGAWASIASSVSAVGHTIESGYRYWARVTAGQSGDRCLWTRLVVDRP